MSSRTCVKHAATALLPMPASPGSKKNSSLEREAHSSISRKIHSRPTKSSVRRLISSVKSSACKRGERLSSIPILRSLGAPIALKPVFKGIHQEQHGFAIAACVEPLYQLSECPIETQLLT